MFINSGLTIFGVRPLQGERSREEGEMISNFLYFCFFVPFCTGYCNLISRACVASTHIVTFIYSVFGIFVGALLCILTAEKSQ